MYLPDYLADKPDLASTIQRHTGVIKEALTLQGVISANNQSRFVTLGKVQQQSREVAAKLAEGDARTMGPQVMLDKNQVLNAIHVVVESATSRIQAALNRQDVTPLNQEKWLEDLAQDAQTQARARARNLTRALR